MLKRLSVAALCGLLVAVPAMGQEKAQEKAAAKPTAAKTAEPAKEAANTPGGLPVNIRIELTITDQVGAGTAAKKVVTMIVGDRQRNSIRSSASIPVKAANMPTSTVYRSVIINVDARPVILTKEPNKMSLEFGLEYQPRSAGGAEDLEPGMASLNERLSIVAESGKPIIVSQAADPASDRKITVELTATILR